MTPKKSDRRKSRRPRSVAGGSASLQGPERPVEEPRGAEEPDIRRVMHELEVHRIEIELQNEELKRARVEAETSLARYSELYEFAPIGYVTLDDDGVIRELNHAAAGLLGHTRAFLCGRSLDSFTSFADRGALSGFLARLTKTAKAEVHVCDVMLVRPDKLVVSVHLTGVHRAQDEPSVLLAMDDVTERKRADDAQREASRRKDEFLSVLSHELRNPLAPILVSLAILEARDPTAEEAKKARKVIERQVHHLTRLVDDLLDAARIGSGKIRLQRTSVDLSALVRSVLQDHQPIFAARGITLVSDVSEAPVWVEADAARITQVLGNLLANAAKFTPREGEVDVTFERGEQKPAHHTGDHQESLDLPVPPQARPSAILHVRDTGVGIAPEMLKRLFQPFMQAPQSLDRSQGGLGLGLAMVKALVEQHEGSVHVQSDGLGRGTEFIIELPLASQPRATLSEPDSSRILRRCIVVIDDNPDLTDNLTSLLTLFGHEVHGAYDGLSGLELARETHPDLVLCDIGLPGMSGYEVAEAVRRDEHLQGVHLVALSGYARPEDRERAAAAGFNEHLAKPPSVERLKRLLAEAPLPQCPGHLATGHL